MLVPACYLACNTIGNLASQDDQVECFGNAAAHLEPGRHFVIEVGLPDLRWLPPGQAKYPPTWTINQAAAQTSGYALIRLIWRSD